MADTINFRESELKVDGVLFTGNASIVIKNNVAEFVDELADEGVRLVRSGIVTKRGTGYTAAGVEKHRKYTNSLFADIRMRPGLERSPGSEKWPASRRAYIINSVLASGVYRGSRSNRKRLDQWGKAATILRRLAKTRPTDRLLRGL